MKSKSVSPRYRRRKHATSALALLGAARRCVGARGPLGRRAGRAAASAPRCRAAGRRRSGRRCRRLGRPPARRWSASDLVAGCAAGVLRRSVGVARPSVVGRRRPSTISSRRSAGIAASDRVARGAAARPRRAPGRRRRSAAPSVALGRRRRSRTEFRPVNRAEPNAALRESSDTSGWVNRKTTTRSRIVDRPRVNAKPFTSPAAK